MTAATVVQVLQDLFYVLLQLLVVAAVILSFKFYCKLYCKFYCSCDPSLRRVIPRHRSVTLRCIFSAPTLAAFYLRPQYQLVSDPEVSPGVLTASL